jgi:hypothetical protein
LLWPIPNQRKENMIKGVKRTQKEAPPIRGLVTIRDVVRIIKVLPILMLEDDMMLEDGDYTL